MSHSCGVGFSRRGRGLRLTGLGEKKHATQQRFTLHSSKGRKSTTAGLPTTIKLKRRRRAKGSSLPTAKTRKEEKLKSAIIFPFHHDAPPRAQGSWPDQPGQR